MSAPKRTISYDDYLRLLGLLTLAADYRKMTAALHRSVCALLGEDTDAGGHADDAIWGDRDARSLLEVLGIEVEELKP